MRWPFILALFIIAVPALADITGPAHIIDGDTIDIAGQRIRLHGIDAPETFQTCDDGGVTWPCGKHATAALVEFIDASPVSCEGDDIDRYGRTIAICYVRGLDIEAWLVRNGWALAYRKYSLDYIDEETAAQHARVGLWRGEFVPPWDWRQGERLQAATAPENAHGCLIKGNISSSGERIFHVPDAQNYEETKISEQKGERWFCTVAEAIAAGWRKAIR
jgi:endonuclease YncB( thermonuclease family)